jgi:acyltransferase
MKDRIVWIDNLRAMGIFLVVLGHHDLHLIPKAFIYSFHMPLFFFISGLLYSDTKYNSIFALFKKRFRTLLVPYWFLGIIQIIYELFKAFISGGSAPIAERFISLIDFSDYWFIGSIFITELAFFIFRKQFSTQKNLILFLILSSVIGFYVNQYWVNIISPKCDLHFLFFVRLLFTTLVFYGFGYLFFSIIKKIDFEPLVKNLSSLIPISLIAQFLAYFYYLKFFTGLSIDAPQNYFLFYVFAFWGIVNFVAISCIISSNSLFNMTGRFTLFIYILHSNPGTINKFYNLLGYKISLTNISVFNGVLFSITIILLILPFALFIEKKLPFILGQNKHIG